MGPDTPHTPLAIRYMRKGTQTKSMFGENKAADVVTLVSINDWKGLKNWFPSPGRRVDEGSTSVGTTTNETIPSQDETDLSSLPESSN